MKIEPAARLDGHIAVPGDKSISHRALLIGALTEGETRVSHWGRSGDTESTLGAVRALGVQVDEEDVDTLVVHGVGLRGLRAPDAPLDCGNAGTLVAPRRRDPRLPGRPLRAAPATSRSRAARWGGSSSR